jgi:hypothetical protein
MGDTMIRFCIVKPLSWRGSKILGVAVGFSGWEMAVPEGMSCLGVKYGAYFHIRKLSKISE